MFLLEKIRNMDKKIDQAFVYAWRIRHNAWKIRRDVYQ